MTVPSLTLAWVATHLERRGLPCNFAVKSPHHGEVATESRRDKRGNASMADNRTTLFNELLAAVDHCSTLSCTERSKGSVDGKGSGNSNDDVDDGNYPFIQPQRSPPKRVASGVARFVEQQTNRTGVVNGPAHASFVLHTVLTACVRHALRYSCLESSHNSSASSATITPEGGVAASPHIAFSWSRTLAADHLAQVMQDAAVQKGMRSMLWKVVNKEHKRIVRDAITLCRSEVAEAAGLDVKVEEEEVRRLFSIPGAMGGAVHEALCRRRRRRSSSSSSYCSTSHAEPAFPAAERQQKQQGEEHLGFLSECHFAFTTTSPRLVELLKAGANEVKPKLRQQGGSQEGLVAGKSSFGCDFAQQMTSFLAEMARVRMAVALLLQFEILARCYASLGEPPMPGPDHGGKAQLWAQEVCALASMAGSRALEPQQNRKRFVMYFRIALQARDALHDAETPYCTLKSMFAALTAKSPPTRLQALPSHSISSDAASAAASSSSRALEELVEGDPLMRAVMTSGTSVKTNGQLTASLLGKKASGAVTRSRLTAAGSEQQAASPTWHFRCCEPSSGPSFDAATTTPCSKDVVKVQLLRPSLHVLWPFTLEATSRSDFNGKGGGDGGSAPSPLLYSNTPGSFLLPDIDVALLMRYNPAWKSLTAAAAASAAAAAAATIGSGGGGMTALDMQHAERLKDLITRCEGRLLSVNGCPVEKIKSVLRIAERAVRLVVRFR